MLHPGHLLDTVDTSLYVLLISLFSLPGLSRNLQSASLQPASSGIVHQGSRYDLLDRGPQLSYHGPGGRFCQGEHQAQQAGGPLPVGPTQKRDLQVSFLLGWVGSSRDS